jgi:hypothetical protein
MLEENFLTKFNPAVSKNWLLVLAGIMWSGVGILLCGYAVTWLAGSKIAQKNIDRILLYANKACLFSFQSWSGYIIIAVMMTGGILLKSSPIPKPYLAIMYTAIGGGLFLSSFRYYARFTLVSRKKSALV